jgi:hypothetical protein
MQENPKKTGNMNIRFSLFFIFFSLALFAQEIRVTPQKTQVSVGESFQLNYDMEQVQGRIQLPNLQGFRQAGTQQSTQIINGRTTQKLTLFLVALEPGQFTIPPLVVNSGAQRVSSPSVSVEVTGGKGNQSQAQNPSENTRNVTSSSGELMLSIEVSKKQPRLGEPVVITAHLYTLYPSISFDEVVFPSIEGGLVKEVPDAADNSFRRSDVNGRVYNHAVIKKWVLIPQQQGELSIQPIRATVRVQKSLQPTNDFDFFFGPRYAETRMQIESPLTRIQVQPLPDKDKPAFFTNAVGQFTFSVGVDKTKMEVNDALTVTLMVKGTGNLPMISFPEPSWPAGFEVAKPAIRDKAQLTHQGYSGSMSAEYVLIANTPGKFSLPSIPFAFFNPKTNRYEIQKGDAYDLTVFGEAATQGGGQVSGETESLGSDIRYVQQVPDFSETGSDWSKSVGWYLACLVLVGLPILLVRFRGRIQRVPLANDQKKQQQALRFAKKQLASAIETLEKGEVRPALKALTSALSHYLTHRHQLPPTQQTLEEVSRYLAQKKAESLADRYKEIKENAEFSLYSPVTEEQTKAQFQKAIQWIVDMEKIRG